MVHRRTTRKWGTTIRDETSARARVAVPVSPTRTASLANHTTDEPEAAKGSVLNTSPRLPPARATALSMAQSVPQGPSRLRLDLESAVLNELVAVDPPPVPDPAPGQVPLLAHAGDGARVALENVGCLLDREEQGHGQDLRHVGDWHGLPFHRRTRGLETILHVLATPSRPYLSTCYQQVINNPQVRVFHNEGRRRSLFVCLFLCF